MVKALVLCYGVIFFTFYFPAITGYWAFGNQVQSNLLQSLMPDEGPSLAPTWLLGLAVVLVLLQLLAIALVRHARISCPPMAGTGSHGDLGRTLSAVVYARRCTRRWRTSSSP